MDKNNVLLKLALMYNNEKDLSDFYEKLKFETGTELAKLSNVRAVAILDVALELGYSEHEFNTKVKDIKENNV